MALTLAPIFLNNMVLQRELPVRIWGWANPGSVVEVRLQGHAASCTTGSDGSWECTLPPLDASESETLEVRANNEHVALANVAVGEVFVAGGQSNMEFWMRYDEQVEEYRPTCTNQHIRF